jgi:hypothetical protein
MNSAYYLCINALEALHTLSNSAVSIYIGNQDPIPIVYYKSVRLTLGVLLADLANKR